MSARPGLPFAAALLLTGLGCNCGAPAVAANEPPQVAILSPVEGAVFRAGPVSLAASADDPEDGALEGAAVVWTSSLSGQLATGTQPSPGLVEGAHSLTVTAVDSRGLSTSASVEVTVIAANSPVVTLVTPAPGTTVDLNQQLDFRCDATTAAGVPLSDADVTWGSALSGALPPGGKMRAALTVSGADTVTCTARDPAAGGASASAKVPVTVSTSRAPTLQVTLPQRDEIWVKTGMQGPYSPSVTFRATAQDFNVAGGAGNLDAAIGWWLDPGAQALGTGPSAAHTFTAQGDYAVTARVTDGRGAVAAASVRVHLVSNLPPQCFIERPQRDGELIQQHQSFGLRGGCFDPETATALSPRWMTTAQPAPLGSGNTLSVQLASLGPQTLSACATDPTDPALEGCARRAVRVFVNTAPTGCAIQAPLANAVVNAGVPVSLRGSSVDAEDPPSTLSFRWVSSVDGALATGEEASSLRFRSVGPHQVTLTVQDPWGLSCQATVNVTVNGAPAVQIGSVVQGATNCLGVPCALSPAITAVGTAADPQGISSQVWKDSLNGVFGTTLVASLAAPAAGRHGVLFSATDSLGAVGSAFAEFTVLPAGRTGLADPLFTGTAVVSIALGPLAGDLAYADGSSRELLGFNDPGGALPRIALPESGRCVFVLPGAVPVIFAGTDGAGVTRCAGGVCQSYSGGPLQQGGGVVNAVVVSAAADLLLLGTDDGLALAKASDPGNGAGNTLVGKRLLDGARVGQLALSAQSTASLVKAWVATDEGLYEVDIAIATPFVPAVAAVAVTLHEVPEVRDNGVLSVAVSPGGTVYAGTRKGFSALGGAGPLLAAPPYLFPDENVQALLVEQRVSASGVDIVVWAGTRSGLIRWDPAVNIPSRLTTADGLPGDDIRSLALGPGGVKYVGTASGLGRYAGD
ncbi:MAG: PKD domain-containing protein [Myxococcaceae bacterium]